MDPTKGELSITFAKDQLEYGSTITIGEGANAKTFELVEKSDSAVTEEGNIRVVLADLSKKSSAEIAAAFKGAIDGRLKDATNAANYSDWAGAIGIGTASSAHSENLVSQDAGSDTIKLVTGTSGSASKEISAESTYGESKNITIGYQKGEDGTLKLQAGDTIKINGKTYQFDTDIRNVHDDNKLIKVKQMGCE